VPAAPLAKDAASDAQTPYEYEVADAADTSDAAATGDDAVRSFERELQSLSLTECVGR